MARAVAGVGVGEGVFFAGDAAMLGDDFAEPDIDAQRCAVDVWNQRMGECVPSCLAPVISLFHSGSDAPSVCAEWEAHVAQVSSAMTIVKAIQWRRPPRWKA